MRPPPKPRAKSRLTTSRFCLSAPRRGYNIGVRLVDEFLAKAQIGTCQSFQETAEVIAKAGFKMFLGVSAEVVGASATEFRLQLTENPLAEFVELPEQYLSLIHI